MNKYTKVALVAAVLLVALSGTGCRRVLLEERRQPGLNVSAGSTDIALDEAQALEAAFNMTAGELTIGGGAPSGKALDGTIDVSGASMPEPDITYSVEGTRGVLAVDQDEVPDFDFGDARNEWDLRLPSDLPLTLRVTLGAGRTDLDLAETGLEYLEVYAGAGETSVDLTGDWDHDLTARIEAGVGQLNLRVPSDVGVRITGSEDGIGDYRTPGFSEENGAFVNEAWDTASQKFEIELRRGVGEVTVTQVP